jgi:hypothetical protein
MEAGLRAIVQPFSLDNTLVRYSALGVKPERLHKASERLLSELTNVGADSALLRDVKDYIAGDELLLKAVKVCTSASPQPKHVM